jgi:hypothetical protein
MFWYIPTIMPVIPKNYNTNEQIKENLLPLASARAGNPNMPTNAPNAYIDWIADLLLLP